MTTTPPAAEKDVGPIHQAMTAFVRRRGPGPNLPTVVGYKEQDYRAGYCETCADTSTVVGLDCVDSDGQPWRYVYTGDFRELIWELTASPDERTAMLDGVRRYDWEDDDYEPPHEDDAPFSTISDSWQRA
jgi:hypothetical protein